jgi:hypothetical protein
MSRRKIKIAVVLAVLLGFSLLALYQFTGGNPYSSDMAELKAEFNRDRGKVRLVTLLSPT